MCVFVIIGLLFFLAVLLSKHLIYSCAFTPSFKHITIVTALSDSAKVITTRGGRNGDYIIAMYDTGDCDIGKVPEMNA